MESERLREGSDCAGGQRQEPESEEGYQESQRSKESSHCSGG